MIPMLLAAVGLLLVLAAYGLARAERLGTGHGVAWSLLGLLLCAGGLLLRLSGGALGAEGAAALALALAVALLIAAGLAQACALTRIEERVKRLAQEVALLRSEGEGRAAGAAETVPGAAGDAANPGPR